MSLWRRIRHLLPAATDRRSDVADDPAAVLQAMIVDAQAQHRQVVDGAAHVVAAQRQMERRLEQAVSSYEVATASARRSLVLADEAASSGDATAAEAHRGAARREVERTIDLERGIASLEADLAEATRAADQARDAVRQSATALQRRLADQQRLLGRLDEARLQEELNASMAQLRDDPTGDGRRFEAIRRDIDRRLATARALTELRSGDPDPGRPMEGAGDIATTAAGADGATESPAAEPPDTPDPGSVSPPPAPDASGDPPPTSGPADRARGEGG